MVASGKQKHRPTLAPQQRRIRHIHSILARNLTWNPKHPFVDDSASIYNASNYADDARSETSGDALTPPSGPSPTTSLTLLPSQQLPPHSPIFTPSLSASATAPSSRRNSWRASLDKQTLRALNRFSTQSQTQPKRTGSNQPSEDTPQRQLARSGSSSSLASAASASGGEDGGGVVKGKFAAAVFASMGRMAASLEEVHPVPKEEKELMDTYFTMHLKAEDPAFYTSETLSKSLNPNFRAIDSSQFASWCNTRGSKVVVRLWAQNSHPENSECQPRENENASREERKEGEEGENAGEGYRLLVEWDVEICCLRYLGKHPRTNHSTESTQIEDDAAADGQKSREHSERVQSVTNLQGMLEEQKRELEHDRRRIDRLREAIRNRRSALEEAGSRHREGEEYLDESQLTLTRNRELHARTTASLNTRRKELLADLFSIYPIEQVSAESSQLQIRGCILPNSVYVGYEEERIATALGYTCHLVCMLAYYLGLPLRYPMRPMGSRAKVTDPVSVVQGSRDFPLYSKGVDRYRFEYGVFLLNKNIEQLMNAYGLIVMDLRHTLANLRYLIQTVLTTSVTSTAPSPISLLSISNTSTPMGTSPSRKPFSPPPILLRATPVPRTHLTLPLQLKSPPKSSTASSSGTHSSTTISPAGSLPSGSPSPPMSPLSASPHIATGPSHSVSPLAQASGSGTSLLSTNGGIAFFARAKSLVHRGQQEGVVATNGVNGIGGGEIAQQI
ncbi:UV radiation resistance protein and autophagy-related subunit 14-domain-containing protein [Endogone sp. FLAS-F59071]|nr:UV radiation resistance protein and autophagy-related subunit 14-domain-containing protein [Endogone sp. FLAS-F59071]|eukprot:RUS20798.1 UV radiation resistance protein and autophagy-related subunit 14-domain-containing protein [Endogone sp. FLAS-F59071]